ncbi:hypothetical protein QM600_01715 [Rhodococcus sp. IEGM 1379]|nr:hypothetical protein [Rhodococcus sp. IEGM 1379]MDI9913961.1 hypothetical protein [Rhodococcus sp. IEGM 1379]
MSQPARRSAPGSDEGTAARLPAKVLRESRVYDGREQAVLVAELAVESGGADAAFSHTARVEISPVVEALSSSLAAASIFALELM